MNRIKSTLLTSLVLLAFNSAYANNTGYEVELIIFEDTTAKYSLSEDWSYRDKQNSALTDNTRQDEKPEPIKDPEYKQLNWDNSKLAENIEKLESNPGFRILLSKRWKQTGLSRDEAFKIPVNTQQASTTDNTLIAGQQPILDSYISGNISLIMSRYLHFNLQLEYYKPVASIDSELVDYVMYPVTSERRMKSRETHYIDHPLVGVIVLATPYKIKEEKPAEATTEYKTL